MEPIDYILDGLMAALELERELGVRTLEFDRSLLAAPANAVRSQPEPAADASAGARQAPPLVAPQPQPKPQPSAAGKPVGEQAVSPSVDRKRMDEPVGHELAMVFLHHAPLNAAGSEMIAKIRSALELTDAETAVRYDGELPRAKVTVVLGALALRKWFPGAVGAPGQWIAAGGRQVLVTYSPDYILRFRVVTPAVREIKLNMWRSLKDAARLVGGR